MNPENNTQERKQEYSGTPEEVGAALVVDALAPTIMSAMESQPPGQVARMLAGMIGALAGLVAANYGPQAASEMLTGTAANVMNNHDSFTPSN